MPRIPREEQATIRHRVDVEGQKVADVAAAYGCTPANIYAILAKLRRQGAQDAGAVVPSPSVAEVGPTTARNAAARPRVSVLYPVRTDGEYSLIVDGAAIVEPGGEAPRLRVTPSKVVLHRPGPSPDPTSSCGADCVPLPVPVMPSRR